MSARIATPPTVLSRFRIGLTIALATLAVGVGCQRAEEKAPPVSSGSAPGERPTFVGLGTCAPCHPRQTEAFSGSHHARAMQTATVETVVGDFNGTRFVHAGVTSTFFKHGERLLQEALRLEPDSAEALHALGLLRVRQGRQADAMGLLRRAAALRPEVTRFAYVYAIALNSMGDPKGALTILEQAHRRRPANRDVLVALVSIARDRGDLQTALRHAETLAALLPADGAVQAQRSELEQLVHPPSTPRGKDRSRK
jgi:hypothetical protein